MDKEIIDLLKKELKRYYPGQYGFEIVAALRKKGIKNVSQQMVYNYFNHIQISNPHSIAKTGIELVKAAKEEARKLEDSVKALVN